MKTLIIGATGNTGQRLLKLSLQEGHDVTVYIRNKSKFQAQLKDDSHPTPRIIVGDVLDRPGVAQACRGQDVVINAAGTASEGEQFVALVKSVSQAVEDGVPGEFEI